MLCRSRVSFREKNDRRERTFIKARRKVAPGFTGRVVTLTGIRCIRIVKSNDRVIQLYEGGLIAVFVYNRSCRPWSKSR